MKLSLYLVAALAAVATAAPAPAPEADDNVAVAAAADADDVPAVSVADAIAGIDAVFGFDAVEAFGNVDIDLAADTNAVPHELLERMDMSPRADDFHQLAKRAFNLKGCLAACASVGKMEKFCRIVPLPPVRAACWGLAVGLKTPWGRTLCKNWCHGIF